MTDSNSRSDDPIKRMLEETDVTRLPGVGKPLKLDEDRFTPDDLRMAHKLLKENDLAPDWIVEGRELDSARTKTLTRLREAVRQKSVTDALRDEVVALNKRILTYNLKVPQGVPHKLMIPLERELGAG